MFLKSILFLLPIALMASEVVWSAKGTSALSEQEYNQAIREYVQMKYPKEAKAWDAKVKESTVVLDGLMWQDNEAAKTVKRDWQGAKDYCHNLTLLGFQDWRLPSCKELLSVTDYNNYNPAIKNGFKNVASHYCWSSSEDVSGSSEAWGVYFNSGSTGTCRKSIKNSFRCVRGR